MQQFGEQGFNIARNAWLQEGFPIETSATTDRPAVRLGPAGRQLRRRADRSGVHDVVIGAGVEHMGHLPFAAGMKTQEEFGFAFTPS